MRPTDMTEKIGHNRVVTFLDRFIPEQFKNNVTDLMRSYIMLGLIFGNVIVTGTVAILIILVDLPADNMKVALSIDGFTLFSYICAFWLFRKTSSQRLTAHFLVLILLVINAYAISITGGFIDSPISQLVILVPVNGFLLLGRKEGMVWLAITVVLSLLAYVAAEYDLGTEQQLVYERHIELLEIGMRFVLLTMVGGALVIYEVINESLNRRLNEERNRFAHEASHDHLTKIPNRLEFFRRLQSNINECIQREQKLAVLYMDLDCFKPVNDEHGHHVGDALLQAVASRLQRSLRLSDTVARLGGDEFALILPGINMPEDVDLVVEKILNCVAEPVITDGVQVSVQGSLGVAIFPDHATDTDDLCRFADSAMYQAKGSENRYVHYQPELQP